MTEEDVKKYAKQTVEDRMALVKELKKRRERKIQNQVVKLINIFDESTEETKDEATDETMILVWQIALIRKKEEKNLEVRIVSNDTLLCTDSLPGKGLRKVAEAIKEVIIPKEQYHDIYVYFSKRLSSYFDVSESDEEQLIIALKRPEETICEKKKADE